MRFVHLHTHSHYSLLDGLAKIDDLIGRAKELGMDALALTDHGNMYGVIEFYKKAQKAGIKPLLGLEAYVAKGSRLDKQLVKDVAKTEGKTKENYNHITLIAQNNTGWKNLLKLSTSSHLEGFYYKPRIDKEILKQYSEGLIALSGCLGGEMAQLLVAGRNEEAEDLAKEFLNIFGKDNFFIEIWHLPHIEEAQIARRGLIEIGKKLNIPFVATQDIHYARPEDNEYQDILLAVQTGNKITDENRLTMKEGNFSMKSAQDMAENFTDVPEAIENTAKIADRCEINIDLDVTRLPKFPVPESMTSMEYLEQLVRERLPNRYPEITPEIQERLDYEIDVIRKTGFADYFLIVQDYIFWARTHGVVVGPGRGSAAGSLVAYALGITDVDPIKYDLLFERFLNPERIQMPDIDVDFADARRDEVVSYVRQRYGEDSVAQIITFGTMAARAAIKDAGRALGISYALCDQIAKLIPFQTNLQGALDSVDELKELYKSDPEAKRLIEAAKKLEGVVRHASVHACGVVVAPEPLTNILPLQRSPQHEDVVITQFEQKDVESLGLLKMDFLGLRNLTIIEETLRLIRDTQGVDFKISEIPMDDEKALELFRAGDTVGVFQFESSGMRRYLKELRPTEFEDVVAMVALYRPGPMELIPLYINRKYGREKVEFLHPKLEPILSQTYGIGIYQEQMMRIARDLAGYSLAEADTLRKAIGKKIKELLDAQEKKLVEGMIANGIDKKIAQQIWELFPPFAKYGFNRSHSVCYALIGYQTAYLKAHYPVEFATALLNSEKDDIERISFLIGEIKKMGIKILPPDINYSYKDFTPENGNIRFGLQAIKNVGSAIVEAIIEERQKGAYTSIEDLLTRVVHKDMNKKSLESLVKAGVCDSFKIERGKLLANMDELLKFSQSLKKVQQPTAQVSLFGESLPPPKATLVLKDAEPISTTDKLRWEKELLGLYVSDHPLRQFVPKLQANKVSPIKTVAATKTGIHRIAGVVTGVKKIVTKSGKPMVFCKVEDFYDGMEVMVFADVLAKNPNIWIENSLILTEGKMSAYNGGEPKFVITQAVELK